MSAAPGPKAAAAGASVTLALARLGELRLAIDAGRLLEIRDGWPDPKDAARLRPPVAPTTADTAAGADRRTLALAGRRGEARLLPVDAVVLTDTELTALHPVPFFLVPRLELLSVMGLVRRPEGLAFLLDVDRLCETTAGDTEVSR